MNDLNYDWDYIIRPDGDTAQLPTSILKIGPSNASQDHLPWSVLTYQDNSIYLGSLRSRPGWSAYLRCRSQTGPADRPVVSDWFKLNVIPGDMGEYSSPINGFAFISQI